MTYRRCWENESWIKPRKHFCNDHRQVLCNGCYTALHARCKWDEIPDHKDVKECLDIVKTLFRSVKDNSESLKAGFYIREFSNELKMFEEMLSKLDDKVRYLCRLFIHLVGKLDKWWQVLWIQFNSKGSHPVSLSAQICLNFKIKIMPKDFES